MTAHDTTRLADLAQRLGIEPRLLLVLCGRVARRSAPLDAAGLGEELERVRAAGTSVAELAMLPYAEYAVDDLEHALELAAWEPPAPEG